MKTIVIVGAGATLAEAPTNRSLDQRPPLDGTFFELCRRAGLPGKEKIQGYMVNHFGIDPYLGGYRMEEVFNYIYSDSLSESPPSGCLDAYWALLRTYASAIARTTDDLDGQRRSGVGELLRKLWRSGAVSEVIVITFNQDLVVEKAIQNTVGKARYSSVAWNLQKAYGLEFGHWLRTRRGHKGFTDSGESSISVLKLHGSLNWVYTVRSGRDPRNSIRAPGRTLLCVNEQKILSMLRVRQQRRWMHAIPLVVPPIYEKGTRFQQVVGPLWKQASEAITDADRLIVFGYSFPDADFGAQSLFRRSFHGNRKIDGVTVIDIDPTIGSKAAAVLGANSVHYYRSVRVFE